MCRNILWVINLVKVKSVWYEKTKWIAIHYITGFKILNSEKNILKQFFLMLMLDGIIWLLKYLNFWDYYYVLISIVLHNNILTRWKRTCVKPFLFWKICHYTHSYTRIRVLITLRKQGHWPSQNTHEYNFIFVFSWVEKSLFWIK